MASLSVKKQNVKSSGEYKLLRNISLFMDTFFLDPILGLIIPGAGDIITATLTIPFIYTSIFKLRSVPLTLTIVYNSLIDMLVGLVPVVGDIGDIMFRSYKKNYKLIVGYVEEDPEVMYEIKNKALRTCVLITGLCIAIRLVFLALGAIISALTPKSCTRDADLSNNRVEQVTSKPSSSSSSSVQAEPYTNTLPYSFDFSGYMSDGNKSYRFVMYLSKVKGAEYEGYYRYLSQPDDMSHRISLSGKLHTGYQYGYFTITGGEFGTERFDIDMMADDKGQVSGDWKMYNSRYDAEKGTENYKKKYPVYLRVN